MYPRLGLLIDGEWIPASGRETLPVHNPATGEQLGMLPIATLDDVDRAIAAANRAYQSWRSVTPLERGRMLMAIANSIRSQTAELARILTLEQGKPLREATLEVTGAADTFEWMAEEGKRVYGRVVPSRFPGMEQLVVHEPVGPVAGFSPWNFPAVLASRKIATALAAGCTIVLKPAEETPGILVAIARLCQQAGLPNGVLNVLYGVPAQISERLIGSPLIKKISFTGSVPVGRQLAALAGAAMKKITLELGGHSPVIVCDDVDADRVAELAVAAKFRNAGQICNCPTRFFVQTRVFDAVVDKFSARARQLRVGNGLEESTQMGPVINAKRLNAMRDLTQDAIANGGEVICGGNTAQVSSSGAEAGLDRGFFWAPTVVANPGKSVKAMREEPFGPFALMIRFDELEEALEAANAIDYGLASYAFTNSLSAAKLIQDRIQAGSLSINTFSITPPELPFSGIKQSGLGSEMGSEGLLGHFNVKAVIRAS